MGAVYLLSQTGLGLPQGGNNQALRQPTQEPQSKEAKEPRTRHQPPLTALLWEWLPVSQTTDPQNHITPRPEKRKCTDWEARRLHRGPTCSVYKGVLSHTQHQVFYVCVCGCLSYQIKITKRFMENSRLCTPPTHTHTQ